ncbi:nucleoside hydrolase [Arenibaculum pallidiluteum]|uniref:nucleoside hydrolase n=1 Tax=Arenibaculum pallidiluteum TaxID=2812559 RepID=UPI001A971A97|nr:nucleoside hydrolase [Arenibaculum pallidiluteum]
MPSTPLPPGSLPRRILIDTDPGQDDAVALMLACASPDELSIAAVTAVAGNVALALTERNARAVLSFCGRPDIPVHAGAAAPLRRPPETAEHIHGRTGLEGLVLPEPAQPPAPGHAVDAILAAANATGPGGLTLCCLGPLTNLALALARDPGLAARLREVVVMGGSVFRGGNASPAAEYNFLADPHAAAAVMASGAAVTLVPLDVTHRALIGPAELARLRGLGNRAGAAVAGLMDRPRRYSVERYGAEGVALHDPCVIAWLLAPGLFAGRHVNLEVETESPLTAGMSVADWWGVTHRPANALVLNAVDRAGFCDLLVERLARLP